LSVFHRGQTNPDLFPQADHLLGDRNGDLAPLRGRRWDAVIDVSAYFPRQVRSLMEIIRTAADHYTFISSISVYRDTREIGIDESYPVGEIDDPNVEEISDESYGPLKALCEQAAQTAMPGAVLTIRPGLIVGPHDSTDRFTYWPARIDRGGVVLAPGEPDRGIQFIDVRDLAEWTVRMAENRQTGVFNATSRPGTITMEMLLHACKQVSGRAARFVWADDDFLLEHNVGPWVEMPLWIPESDGNYAGFMRVSVQKAVAAGLTFRTPAETVRATLEWARTRPADYTWKAGLAPEREAELIRELEAADT
jgi:2'-hydroxyisoflavone reductase